MGRLGIIGLYSVTFSKVTVHYLYNETHILICNMQQCDVLWYTQHTSSSLLRLLVCTRTNPFLTQNFIVFPMQSRAVQPHHQTSCGIYERTRKRRARPSGERLCLRSSARSPPLRSRAFHQISHTTYVDVFYSVGRPIVVYSEPRARVCRMSC